MEQLKLRSTGLEWREVEDEVVVLDLERSVYVSVNRTASLLWTSLAIGTNRQALIERLVDDHGVARVQAEADVDRFVRSLDEQNLLDSSTR